MEMFHHLLVLLLLCLHADLVPVLQQEVPADAQHAGVEEAQCVQPECNDDKVDKMIEVLEKQFAAQMQLLKDLVKCQCRQGQNIKIEDDTKEPKVEQLLPGSTRKRTGKALKIASSPIEGSSEVAVQGSSFLPTSRGESLLPHQQESSHGESKGPPTIPALAGAGPLSTAEERARAASKPRSRPDNVPDHGHHTFKIFPDCDGECPSMHRAYHKRPSDPSVKLSPDPLHGLSMRAPKAEMMVEESALESPGEKNEMTAVEAELAAGNGLKPKQSSGRTTFSTTTGYCEYHLNTKQWNSARIS